ncbi:HlyD family type I secretion periplasmic adaptor subunit [Shinella sp. NM-101]|uniref:HlyD family type I secretion periplasmic adaptor subunit n=1 Tax=Shinella sp. NM-101 TaxID=2744455 RepID=UPI001F3A904D|nr:HlyD family type I secretion periplasmic adaptor subunit [Shinella sp. NM-101]
MGKDEKAIAPTGQADWYADVPRSIRLHVIVGMTALGVTFCGFGVWAATAPLASAIIAQGSFVATGNNKIVQHLEGGIIKELHVGEGSKVREGDVLVTLDDTAALANERALKLRWLRLEAVVARLRAEALGARVFALPPMLVKEASDPDVVAIAESQHVIFNSRKVKLEEQLNLVDKNIRSLEFRSKGYRGQKEALERQVVLLEEERDSKAKLSKAGYMKRTDYLAVERAIADAMGDIARIQGEVNESDAQIDRYKQEAVIAVNTLKQSALDALETADSDLDAVREQMRGASGVLDRTVIRSPVTGTVVRSYYHTAGGVITTGKPIMEILPAGVPLIIEAQVLRTSIDQVREGETAVVRLSALSSRTTPVLDGKVIYVSADSVDEGTLTSPKDVYIVRVQVPEKEIRRIAGFHPVPGMPADILIQTSERTFFQYITKPIADSMSRAFKEK